MSDCRHCPAPRTERETVRFTAEESISSLQNAPKSGQGGHGAVVTAASGWHSSLVEGLEAFLEGEASELAWETDSSGNNRILEEGWLGLRAKAGRVWFVLKTLQAGGRNAHQRRT